MAPVDVAGNPLALVTVHAHPDDEASKGAATVARYSAEGIRASLVCCTGGEEGEVLNPEVDTPEVRSNLAAIRIAELRASTSTLGYASVHLLGYRDSGMDGTDANARSDNFANTPLEDATAKLVAIIRDERPQVLVTYGNEASFYRHPDHVKVHDVSVAAFDAAGNGHRFPDMGEPWQPSKLYYCGTPFRRIVALHEAYERVGHESPYADRVARFPATAQEASPTTLIDVSDFLDRRRAALLAHRTQIAPDSHWMQVPDALLRETYPWDEYVLARSFVDNGLDPGELERDLFAGVRAPVGAVR